MIKIGVMGLGNIALKAYVPVMNDLREEVEWHYFSRDQTKMTQLSKKYNWQYTYSNYQEFVESGITACFVHTPTSTHGEIIKQLLNRGIHVFVDKPISEDFEEVLALSQLAKEKGLILMTGFNRRFAPLNQRLKSVSQKNLIIAQKNRQVTKAAVKFELFDMMIHMVDTVLYLLDEPVEKADYQVVASDEGILERALITFKTANTTAIASTNMLAGAHTETIEIQSPSGTYRVMELARLEKNECGIIGEESFGDWEDTLVKRGFSQLIRQFITLLGSPTTASLTTIETSLISHDYVNRLYQTYTSLPIKRIKQIRSEELCQEK